jgi:transglutaminase-like putative cysteine protease
MVCLCVASPAPAQEQETRDRLGDSYGRLIAKFRKELESADARPWDVAARARSIGNDPKALCEFVRKLRFEPYPGMQRGPAGVLVSGGGNSADKAFLLAEMLKAVGREGASSGPN